MIQTEKRRVREGEIEREGGRGKSDRGENRAAHKERDMQAVLCCLGLTCEFTEFLGGVCVVSFSLSQREVYRSVTDNGELLKRFS